MDKKHFIFAAACIATLTFATSEIRDAIVEGDGLATVRIQCLGCSSDRPAAVNTVGNKITLTWADAMLSEKHHGKLELADPHPLLSRISLIATERNQVTAILIVRGSTEELAQRLHLNQGADGVTIQLAYPTTSSNTLALLRNEEELPIKSESSIQKSESRHLGGGKIAGIIAIILLAAGTSVFGARFLKAKGKLGGQRRFLIEKVAQTPLDSKASVCLLKIGGELVLVGVTGQNVSFLSNMPRLQEEYDSESRLERRAFKDAVEDEFRRIKNSPLSA